MHPEGREVTICFITREVNKWACVCHRKSIISKTKHFFICDCISLFRIRLNSWLCLFSCNKKEKKIEKEAMNCCNTNNFRVIFLEWSATWLDGESARYNLMDYRRNESKVLLKSTIHASRLFLFKIISLKIFHEVTAIPTEYISRVHTF